ncbi:MAG TPA: peptidase, partial [Erysipelotrichaceae bacterium]|nr:peptidase [Erysipelotrichaceae bacterium]
MPKEKVLIKLQRHEWPDEIEAKRRRRNRWSVMIVLLVLTFGFGWLFGSFLNKPVLQLPADSSRYQRLDAIVETLKAQWYFGKDIENLEQTLIDRAISGMIEQNGDR